MHFVWKVVNVQCGKGKPTLINIKQWNQVFFFDALSAVLKRITLIYIALKTLVIYRYMQSDGHKVVKLIILLIQL